MVQFSRLRLSGFKSFVDRTEFEINPGLTGVVGPNGCGKSNLVEALRWSMGENSSKKMRGGSRSMEDVIFAGTANRPARNMAEVSVLLDNSARTAPAPFNDFDEIEVVRKIERDHGSSYRINGKNVRARDVQLLYADILAGANSPFLVSQGKVTTMIQAKPSERRMLLEEAAGISGLYARRHEAEIRLRATDNNLKRLDDQAGIMENRLQSLKKQVRQAHKYRNLSARIRQLEVMAIVLEWLQVRQALTKYERAYNEADSQVASHMTTVSQLTKTQNAQSQELPDLREKDAKLGAAIQANKLALQRLEDELAALDNAEKESVSQLEQIKLDRAHETQTLSENTALLEKLEREAKSLSAFQGEADDVLTQMEEEKEALKAKVQELDGAYTAKKEEVAADKVRLQSLTQKLEQEELRQATLEQKLASLVEECTSKKETLAQEDESAELSALIDTLEKDIEAQRTTLQDLQDKLEKEREAQKGLEETLQEKRQEKTKISTQINTLQSILNSFSKDDESTPILDNIITEKGFETALSRALGDTLMASEDGDATIQWRRYESRDDFDWPALPDGVEPLSPHVKAPDVLQIALSQIGVVNTAEHGDEMASQLKPGQSLVSEKGDYWRWDGLYIRSDATDQHTEHLRQRNVLEDLQATYPALEKDVAKAESAIQGQKDIIAKLREDTESCRTQTHEMESRLREIRQKRDRAMEQNAELKAEIAKAEEAIGLYKNDLSELKPTIKTDQDALQELQKQIENDARSAEIDKVYQTLSEARETLQDKISQYEQQKQEHNRKDARLRAIADERVNIQNRCIRSRERMKELDTREGSLIKKREMLSDRPGVIKTEKESCLNRIIEGEAEKREVSDKLALYESELADTTKALKEAEAKLANAREERARIQTTFEERQSQLKKIETVIRDNYQCSPMELKQNSAVDEENPPNVDDLKTERESCIRQRDQIGPVNLRAEQEATELEEEFGTILKERADLMEAVAELRGGINKLNKEARERLQVAFEQVNQHFRVMFTRLFNGGKAHLALIESDDPLEAGLEIFAQPPGKALQSLSLLSGGEQTLTAVALLFAMFLTNPAPICVLDEVDAPLDDANVDRVCDLLEEFAEQGNTRFLIITHHRLTMARMDRLYGVTMGERGVSQLVSVDLNQQLDFLEAAE